MCRSEPHTPVASTRTTASSRAKTSGSGRSSIRTSPGAWKVTACMAAGRLLGRRMGRHARRVLRTGRRSAGAERADARAVGPRRTARRASGRSARPGGRALSAPRRHAGGADHLRDPGTGAPRPAGDPGADRAPRAKRGAARGVAERTGGGGDARECLARARRRGRRQPGLGPRAARARPRGDTRVLFYPPRRGVPHRHGVALRQRRLPGARPGDRVDADAGAARRRRGTVAATTGTGGGGLGQRGERRSRLRPLPLHQHRPQRPPAAHAGRRVGLPRCEDACGRSWPNGYGPLGRTRANRTCRADVACEAAPTVRYVGWNQKPESRRTNLAYFKDADEVYAYIGKLFEELSEDEELAPKFRKANTIVQYRYRDPDSQITVKLLDGQGGQVDFGETTLEPEVVMSMDADTAHRFWLGNVNVTVALARGQMKAKGPVAKILKLVPLVKPVFPRYRRLLADAGRQDLLKAA